MLSRTLVKKLIENYSHRTCARQFCENVFNKYERSLNQVTLIGRTGNDPQKRGTDANPVVVFSLATNVVYKTEGQPHEKVEWHRICVFKPILRDTVYDYLKKGQRVYVSGRLTYGEVRDEAGMKTTLTSIIADDVIFFQR